MLTLVRVQTKVLPGKRIEISVPELPEEGETVEVMVWSVSSQEQSTSMRQLAESLPRSPSPRLFPDWRSYEEFLRGERDAWDT